MLKRSVARLLMFGIGLLLSYFVTHRSAPAPVEPLIVCVDHSGERRLLIVRDPADCAERVSPQIRTSRPAVVPANSWTTGPENDYEAVFAKETGRTF